MHARIVFLLIGILLLGSCTIEKRLYNRGWHVEFHQKIKSGKELVAEKNVMVSDSIAETSLLTGYSIPLPESEKEQTFAKEPIEAQLRVQKIDNQEEELVNENSVEGIKQTPFLSKNKALIAQKIKPKTWSRSAKRTSTVVVTVLLVFALIMFFSLLFIINSSVDLAALFALGFFMVIFGLMALILFVLLLTMLIIKPQERLDREEAEEEYKNEKVKSLPSEERGKYEREQQKNDRDGKVAAGFVVIVLLLILGVAVLS